ncbi:hypothetical protein MAR_009236 [Mya arenaria]|uniref:Uncharacterized protein n=1 Tax=Mya arenaria TaxID=6604 RepID=A0ABY7E1H1_MYAAR|nr:hypothetical protein MAR_009236 [Mya arenaria]
MAIFFLSHLQKIVTNCESPWFYFAKYWISLTFRKYNAQFSSNLYPKSDSIPPFYQSCLIAFADLMKKCPDFDFQVVFPTKKFYFSLLYNDEYKVKVTRIFPQNLSKFPCQRRCFYRETLVWGLSSAHTTVLVFKSNIQ